MKLTFFVSQASANFCDGPYLGVPTHSQRPSSSRDSRYEYTSIVASETLRVSCQENFKAGALRQNVGKVTIIHLKDPRR